MQNMTTGLRVASKELHFDIATHKSRVPGFTTGRVESRSCFWRPGSWTKPTTGPKIYIRDGSLKIRRGCKNIQLLNYEVNPARRTSRKLSSGSQSHTFLLFSNCPCYFRLINSQLPSGNFCAPSWIVFDGYFRDSPRLHSCFSVCLFIPRDNLDGEENSRQSVLLGVLSVS